MATIQLGDVVRIIKDGFFEQRAAYIAPNYVEETRKLEKSIFIVTKISPNELVFFMGWVLLPEWLELIRHGYNTIKL